MPKKGVVVARPYGNPHDPEGFTCLLLRFQEWLTTNNYSIATIKGCETYLWKFFAWCDARGVEKPNLVTREHIEKFQRWLYHAKNNKGKPFKISTQTTCLANVRIFFRFLARQNLITYNPASSMVMPRQAKTLPRNVLSPMEVEEVINQADVSKPLGLRDRTIMELLYASGIRRRELAVLKIYDLNLEDRTLFVREAKGKKDRYIPVGKRAVAWVEKDLAEVRPNLISHPDDGTLFLSGECRPFNPDALGTVIRKYFAAAGVKKGGACHIFRHSMATAMLENGADIRFIQQMLGHERLDTTQIYTHVSIQKLKEVHKLTHPARMERDPS